MSEFKPIPLTETQMAELFRLRAELAASQAEVARLKEINADTESKNFNLVLELSKEKESASNLCRVLNDMNGPTRMGEPVYPYRQTILDRLEEQLTAARAEIDGLKADAERYRWLRDTAKSVDWARWIGVNGAYFCNCRTSAIQMDSEIDAAMSNSSGVGNEQGEGK